MHLVLLLFVAGLLGACTPALNINHYASPPESWPDQLEQRYQLLSWALQGRLAVQSQDDGGQADLIWRQGAEGDFNIQLNAPLGAGSLEIFSRNNGVVLLSSDGDEIIAPDVETLMQRLQGWQIPISGLRYWLLGVPVPDRPYRLTGWLDKQQLYTLEQNGWQIEFRQYQTVGQMQLPRKVFMRRQDNADINVKIIIRHWDLAHE